MLWDELPPPPFEALDLERVAWRCRQSGDFYKKLIAFMNQHHVMNVAVFSYGFLHNDPQAIREYLKSLCGPASVDVGRYLTSKLLTIDPIELRTYEHLEYSPLVNQRAHRVGSVPCDRSFRAAVARC